MNLLSVLYITQLTTNSLTDSILDSPVFNECYECLDIFGINHIDITALTPSQEHYFKVILHGLRKGLDLFCIKDLPEREIKSLYQSSVLFQATSNG